MRRRCVRDESWYIYIYIVKYLFISCLLRILVATDISGWMDVDKNCSTLLRRLAAKKKKKLMCL